MSVTSARREREKIEMRQLIVDAAVQMYLEEGYEKLSLRGIAGKIEYAVGTIYLYFKDKHELFHAMHEWAFERLFGEFEQLQSIQNPLERMQALSRVYINFAFSNPELYDLMFILNEPMCADKNLEEWPCGQKTFAFLHQTVSECLEQGYLKEGDAGTLSLLFWSAVHGTLALHMRNRLRMYDGIDHKALVVTSMDLLLRQFVK